jgi:hypothetical protein
MTTEACSMQRRWKTPTVTRATKIWAPLFYGSGDSSVGTAIRYGLDGPGIESRWGREFPHLSRRALRPTQPPIQWVPGLSRGVKLQERGVDHPPPSSAEVKERVKLYLYFPCGLLWSVLGLTLHLLLLLFICRNNFPPFFKSLCLKLHRKFYRLMLSYQFYF